MREVGNRRSGRRILGRGPPLLLGEAFLAVCLNFDSTYLYAWTEYALYGGPTVQCGDRYVISRCLLHSLLHLPPRLSGNFMSHAKVS